MWTFEDHVAALLEPEVADRVRRVWLDPATPKDVHLGVREGDPCAVMDALERCSDAAALRRELATCPKAGISFSRGEVMELAAGLDDRCRRTVQEVCETPGAPVDKLGALLETVPDRPLRNPSAYVQRFAKRLLQRTPPPRIAVPVCIANRRQFPDLRN